MSVENAAVPAAAETITDLAAREKIAAPENTNQVNAAEAVSMREPVKPPEQASTNAAMRDPLPKPEQATHPSATHAAGPAVIAMIPAHSSNVVTPEAFVKAEQNLAAYFANTLDPQITKGMQLTLSNVLSDSPDGRTGGTDVKLCFTGPAIEANFAELSRELVKSLQTHPALSVLLKQKEHSTLLIEQAHSNEKGQMLHLHLPNLTPEHYAQLIDILARGTTPAQLSSKQKGQMDEAVSSLLSALVDSQAHPTLPAAKEPVIKAPEVKPPVTNEPTKAESAAPNEAASTVQAPVIKMETIKEAPLGLTA